MRCCFSGWLNRYRGLFCAAAIWLVLTGPGRAENWPRFRGPSGQGISTEEYVPQHWNATSNVVWKTPLLGEGWSSPIVWGDYVFLTSTKQSGAKCLVLCLDRVTGQVRWEKVVCEQVPLRKEGKNSYATPTPCTDGERVYAVFGDGSVVALALDGSMVWTNRDVRFYSRHGLGASPVLYGGLLIMPYDGSNRVTEPGQWPNNTAEERLGWQIPWERAELVALDVRTGKRKWTGKRGMSRIAHATPVIFREHNTDQILSLAGDVIQAFKPDNGERLWSVYAQGEGLVPSPVIGEGMIFASSGFEKTTLRGIRLRRAGAKTEPEIAWEQKKGVPTQSSLIYIRPFLYGITDGGIATCYRPENGNIVWQERVGGNHSASPVYAAGRIYFLSEAGETTLISAGPEFKIHARNPLNEKCQASIAISQGQLFIRTDKHLFCIGSGGSQ